MIRADVTRPRDVKRAVDSAARQLGGLDIVVTAAGVTSKGDLATTDLETWRRLIDINLTGTFLVCHEAIPHLRRSTAGAIVTISSVYSLIGGRERTAYSASSHLMKTGMARPISLMIFVGIRHIHQPL